MFEWVNPECQPITMRMDFDLYDYFVASVDGTLSSLPPTTWKSQFAVCVVLASKRYLQACSKDDEITGFDSVPEGAIVFHAGAKKSGEKILSNGGCVLGVTALGVTALGVTALGVTVLGVTALGVTALGVTALGVTALGVTALGVTALGVTALCDTLESAIKNAYATTEKITWFQKFNRKDIGQKGLSYL